MSDKSTRIIVEALTRAATEPGGLALFASKGEPGLFPSNTTARFAADQAKASGWLEVLRQESRGKQTLEVCGITDSGKEYLAEQSDPRQLLEDCVRVLEARETDVAQVKSILGSLEENVAGLKSLVQSIVGRFETRSPKDTNGTHPPVQTSACVDPMQALASEIYQHLVAWATGDRTSPDYPLSELFRALQMGPVLTIGLFHDTLRAMHQQSQIYLHPWTAPLYTMPEPCFALLVGHEVAYYASRR